MPTYASPSPSQERLDASIRQRTSQEPRDLEVGDFGSNADQQCALAEGCDAGVPPLDDVFHYGFADEHGSLLADVTSVTGMAMQLEPQVTLEDLAAMLDHHVDGALGLEEALGTAIGDAQASAFYGEGAVDVDPEAVERVYDLQDRLETSLDILREHNGLAEAVLAYDFSGKAAMLSSFVAGFIEAGLERSLEAACRESEEALERFQESWKVAGLSIAKIPADLAVSVGVEEAIAVGVPVILASIGTGGVFPAVFVAGTIAFLATEMWESFSEDWGPDVSGLHEGVEGLDAKLEVGANAASVSQVGAGLRSAAEATTKINHGVTLALDLDSAGKAGREVLDASAAWEAFKAKQASLQVLWEEASALMGGFLRFAEQMRAAGASLEQRISEHEAAIRSLESVYGVGLYAT